MAPTVHSAITHHVICILPAGDALHDYNFIARHSVHVAVKKALEFQPHGVQIAFFGCRSPEMKSADYSAAQSLQRYMQEYIATLLPTATPEHRLRLEALLHPLNQKFYDTEDVNSVSRSCKLIVEKHLAMGDHVYVATTWLSSLRTYYLLYYQTTRAKLSWPTIWRKFWLLPSGGTLYHEFVDYPFSAIPRWCCNVLWPELQAWYKAWRHPDC